MLTVLQLRAAAARKAAGLARAISPSGEPVPGTASGYGPFWSPHDEREARVAILAEEDAARFEASGRADAEQVGRLVRRDATVLDLGCGIGRVARYMAERCRLLWASDASPVMLEMAGRRLADRPNVRLVQSADVAIPEIPDHSVDVAYSILVLQHLEREDAFLVLRELRRVLRPAGAAYLTFPNLLSDTYLRIFLDSVDSRAVGNLARTRMYTPEEVMRLLPAAGLRVEGLRAEQEIIVVCRPDDPDRRARGAGERTRTSIPEGTGT
ncbi:MAG: class I SAM-dependent methyltransferase [Acidimicrobiales bacterium]|nr:class I SAM-dependent methyltransferase [Acidimicrobiales bacterium]MBO0886987.1 class I SAM-dependent methyltransferase [Acidimicrobiales bacterium]